MNREQIKKVKEVLEEIQEKISDGSYIFRGESKNNPKISSALYRSYERICKDELRLPEKFFSDELNLTGKDMQNSMHENVEEYVYMEDSESLLTELQHYGGHTNRIDFSRDYLIALFFVCNGDEQLDDDGRLILLRKNFAEIIEPRKNQNNRVIFQRSVFVEQDSGYIPDDACVIYPVPAHLKPLILKYLKEYHDISKETIYGDLPGYIENQKDYQKSHIYFQKGFNHSKKEEYAEAIRAYDESIRLKSNYTEAYFNRGDAYRERGEGDDYEKAITDYDMVIELNPKDDMAYNNRGIVYTNEGLYKKAMADFNKVIELNPKDDMAYNNRGIVYANEGLYKKAMADFNKVIELKPNDDMAYNNRGVVYKDMAIDAGRKGNFDKSIADYNKAIGLNPKDIKAHFNLGIVKNLMGNLEEAKAHFQTALKMAEEQNDKKSAAHIKNKIKSLS